MDQRQYQRLWTIDLVWALLLFSIMVIRGSCMIEYTLSLLSASPSLLAISLLSMKALLLSGTGKSVLENSRILYYIILFILYILYIFVLYIFILFILYIFILYIFIIYIFILYRYNVYNVDDAEVDGEWKCKKNFDGTYGAVIQSQQPKSKHES